MKIKRILSLMLAICLCLTVLPSVIAQAEAAGYFTENDVRGVECTILSNPAHAAYVNAMMRYHILSPDNNYRIGRNLENGSSVVFFFDGCSDNVDDPVYGDYNNYHLSAYCAVVQKVDGALKVVFESENCTTIPDNPRDASLNDNMAVPTVLDGVYNIISTNHKGRYAALNISDYNWVAPVIRCDDTTSYISSSDGINIHARRYFPDVPENGVSSETYNSTGCLNVGLIGDSYQEYNDFIYTVLGVSDAIVTTPDEDGQWTKCEPYLDKGVVVVDRSQYKTQLAAIYGDDSCHTASELVSRITDYSDVLNGNWNGIFADVDSASWQFTAAKYAAEKNLMTGKGTDIYGRIKFDPNSPISREEFVQVLYNAEGKPSVTIANKFPDVAENGWYKNAVVWANAQDIASGMGNGNFGVGKNITRQDLALMLMKYAALKGCSLNAEAGKINQYADGNQVADYARTAMDWAVTNGVLSGKGTAGKPLSTFRLDPTGTATRAECAAMLKNFRTAFGL